MLMRLLLFLLALSLILQNACPYGFSVKTAFASPPLHMYCLHHLVPPVKDEPVHRRKPDAFI